LDFIGVGLVIYSFSWASLTIGWEGIRRLKVFFKELEREVNCLGGNIGLRNLYSISLRKLDQFSIGRNWLTLLTNIN